MMLEEVRRGASSASTWDTAWLAVIKYMGAKVTLFLEECKENLDRNRERPSRLSRRNPDPNDPNKFIKVDNP